MTSPQDGRRFHLSRRLSHSGFSLLLILGTAGCGSCGSPPDPEWCTTSSSTPLTLDAEEELGSSQSALSKGKGADTGDTFTSAVRIDSGWSEQVEKKHWAIWYWFHGYAPDLITVTHGKKGSGVLIAQNLVLTTATAVKDGQPIEHSGQKGFLVRAHMPVMDKQIMSAYPKPTIESSGGFAVVDPSGADVALVFVEPSNSGKDKRYALPEMPVMYDWDETKKCCSKQHLMLVGHGDEGVRRSSLSQVIAGSGKADSIQTLKNGAEAGDVGAPWLAKLRMDQGTINPAYPWTIVGLQKGEVAGSGGLNDSPGDRESRNSMVKIKKSTVDWISTEVENENNRREEAWYSLYYGSAGDEVEGDPKIRPDYVPLSDFAVGTPYTHQFTSLDDDCSNGSTGTFALGDGMCVGQEHTLQSTTQPLEGGTNSYANVPSIGDLHQSDMPSTGQTQHACTGSLVSENHVLTAAHCVVFRDKNTLKLDPDWKKRVFKFRTSQKDAMFVDGWATVHPDYDHNSPTGLTATSNDLAVIHLKSSIKLQDPVGLAQLWPFNVPKTHYMRLGKDFTTCGNKVFAYGDGRRGPSDYVYSEGYATLAYLAFPGDPEATQDKRFNFGPVQRTGGVRPGDSGGPTVAIRDTDGVFFQIGVHSTGAGSSYTDTRLVQAHIDWIQTTINDNTSAPADWNGGTGSSPAKTVTAEMVGCRSCGGKPKKGP